MLPATSWSCTAPPSPPPHCSPGLSNESLMITIIMTMDTTTIMMAMETTMMMTMMKNTMMIPTMCVVCLVERVVPVLSSCYQVLHTKCPPARKYVSETKMQTCKKISTRNKVIYWKQQITQATKMSTCKKTENQLQLEKQ